MLTYLKKGSLPGDEKQAKQLLLEWSQFDLIDGVLHYEDSQSPGHFYLVVTEEWKTQFWMKYMEDDLVYILPRNDGWLVEMRLLVEWYAERRLTTL